MTAIIDYFFAGSSPFTYLGHQAICDVAGRHGARLNFKPVNPLGIWENSGSVPLPQRSPARRRYRFLELQRLAQWRGLPITLKPAFFPVDSTLADCCAIAIVQSGGDPAGYLGRVFSSVWVHETDISNRDVVASLLRDAGFPAGEILAEAGRESIQNIRRQYTREAIESDAIGVPAFVLNGEVFWGQDRIEFVDQALASGRSAYKPLPI